MRAVADRKDSRPMATMYAPTAGKPVDAMRLVATSGATALPAIIPTL
jgi:hypothetical protein